MDYIIGVILFALLAAFDAVFTNKQLNRYGIDIELNPLIRLLCRKIGIKLGVGLGVGVPTAILTVGALLCNVPQVIYIGVIARLILFAFQMRQLLNGK